jgi:hypothetical protein
MNDVIETLLMSTFFEGRLHTFSPVTYLDRKGLSLPVQRAYKKAGDEGANSQFVKRDERYKEQHIRGHQKVRFRRLERIIASFLGGTLCATKEKKQYPY